MGWGAAGTEIGFALVRARPFLSLTGGHWSTRKGRRGGTRTRKQLTREIVQHTQRIQAILAAANIKLTSVTDIWG